MIDLRTLEKLEHLLKKIKPVDVRERILITYRKTTINENFKLNLNKNIFKLLKDLCQDLDNPELEKEILTELNNLEEQNE